MVVGKFRIISDGITSLWNKFKQYAPTLLKAASSAYDAAAPMLSAIPGAAPIVSGIGTAKNVLGNIFSQADSFKNNTGKFNLEDADDSSGFIKFKKPA